MNRPDFQIPARPAALPPDPGAFRVVADVTTSGVAVLRCEGRCDNCRDGWTFSHSDGYSFAERCKTCGPLATHAERFTAARLPHWAHRVRSDWREDIAPLGQAADLAGRLHARRELGRTYHGDTGRGKSFRVCAVALAWLEAGGTCMWITWPTYVAELRDRLAEREGGLADAVGRPLQTPLLIIDELAEGHDTPFAREIAERIVGGRAEGQLPMLITSNRTLGRIRDYIGDRAWSRLAAYRVTEVTGTDLRAEGGR